jgi:hypothetical protein
MDRERTIYIVNGSIASWRVLIALSEKGLLLDGFPNLSKYELHVRERHSARSARPEGWLYDRTSKPNLFKLAEIL